MPLRIASRILLFHLCFLAGSLSTASANEAAQDAASGVDSIAASLRNLDAAVLPQIDVSQEAAKRMLSRGIQARRRVRNREDVEQWRAIDGRDSWERFRDARITRLRNSLGRFPDPPERVDTRILKTLTGDGFTVDCMTFESRPGLRVTANLYRPAKASRQAGGERMPGILICHSHHNPKTQGELQDMGMTWARQGCLVLVIDQLGHGERREHPFRSADDFPDEFRVSRQDYHFRYHIGIQLHLIGDSLIGWMAWDMMRAVDVLYQQPGIDRDRILLLGAVAGGGDPAAVVAAIDQRIKGVVPFNFGGPQPENVFPLPEDAELSFNYVGGGSWESTRNLRDSAEKGFLPWVIVGSVAPRPLIYAHEFSWDQNRDPVWKRLQTIFGWYDSPDKLATVVGYGRVTLSSKEASHCNNIGAYHRKQIHPLFQQWFDIPAPDPEYRERFESKDLLCLQNRNEPALTPARQIADRLAASRIAEARELRSMTGVMERASDLRKRWSKHLRSGERTYTSVSSREQSSDTVRVIKLVEQCDDGALAPIMLLLPKNTPTAGAPLVVVVSQAGKQALLRELSGEFGNLLNSGIAVALVDLRGVGETAPGDSRGRRSYATGLSSSELMLGGTIIGQQLGDLRNCLKRLRSLATIDGSRVAVWGESLAKANAPDAHVVTPLGSGHEPAHAEPMGPMLALLAALYEPKVNVVLARGGLVSFRSVLKSPCAWIPHDVVVPGMLTTGDLADLGAAIAPRPLRIERMVTGLNQIASKEQIESEWQVAKAAYRETGADQKLSFQSDSTRPSAWLIRSLTNSSADAP